MRRMAARQHRRFTYTLVVAPEHFGSVCYLSALADAEAARLRWGVFLESLGTSGPIALQRSFTGTSLMDRALTNVLTHRNGSWRS